MSVVKVIELIAKSEVSWENAVKDAVKEASKSVRNITSVYVKDFHCSVENGQVKGYKATVKLSFLVEDE